MTARTRRRLTITTVLVGLLVVSVFIAHGLQGVIDLAKSIWVLPVLFAGLVWLDSLERP